MIVGDKLTNKIFDRNKKILKEVMSKIDRTCPNAIDMVAIGGSFASNEYYEKSDLDIVIIRNNEEAKEISTSFIMDDIGYDIYTSSWDDLKNISKYENPYVSKLKQLDIIYTKNDEVKEKYKELQADLNDNMHNDELIKSNISKLFSKILSNYNDIMNCENISNAYKILGNFMYNLENIFYLLNGKYIEHGVKGIPVEISKMDNIPRDIVSKYYRLPDATGINEIIEKMFEIEKSLETFLKGKDINVDYEKEDEIIVDKEELKREDLKGSFEKLYSNYYNKLKHAYEINDKYLSFRTMINAQRFYDEYSSKYNLEEIDLIGNYNPNNLKSNHGSFVSTLLNWKKLCDLYSNRIKIISNITELYDNSEYFKAYQSNNEKELIDRLETEEEKIDYTKKASKIY